MKQALTVLAVIFALAATCVATDVAIVDDGAPVLGKPVAAAGPLVAVAEGVEIMRVSPRTLAVLQVDGDPATGEITVTQLSIVDSEGKAQAPNTLFTQISGSCTGCNNPQTGSCTRTIRFDVDYTETATRYICDANIALEAATSMNVTSISNPTWESTSLPADLEILGTTETTYFGFDVTVTDCTQGFRVFVNLEGLVSPNPCERLAFVLTWAAGSDADLDLRVDGPGYYGEGNSPCSYPLYFSNPSECDGTLEQQCNTVGYHSDCGTAQQALCANPQEVIAWDPVVYDGNYKVFVWAFDECSGDLVAGIPFTVRVYLDGVQQGSDHTGTIYSRQYWYTQESLPGIYDPLFTYTAP